MKPIRLTIVFLAVALTFVFAASAQAYVYWGDPHAGTIGRANNDGSGATDTFINAGGEPVAVAVNSGHIYWANKSGGTIGRANIDGLEVEPDFITGLGQPSGVAVTPSYLFWSDLKAAKIGRANLDGTGKLPSLISTEATPCGVAVDSGNVYWTNNIGFEVWAGRATFSGGSAEKTWFKIENNVICGVAVNSANIFWAGTGFSSGKTIGRANITDGGALNHSLIGEADGPCGLAVFGLQMYWANGGDGTIGRANTDGTSVDPGLVKTGGGEICGVAVDSLSSPLTPPPSNPSSPAPESGGSGQAAPPAPTPPAGTVSVKGVKYDKKRGTARVTLVVNEAGTVSVTGKGLVGAKAQAQGAGTVVVTLRAAKRKLAALKQTGKLAAKLVATFTPSGGGSAAKVSKAVSLQKQASHPPSS